jgi:peptidoglycan/LPS O-acetylase OafA/YrhL
MKSAFDSPGNNLDCLRLVFAVTVIFSHSYAIGIGMQTETYGAASQFTEPMLLWSHGQTTFGIIAVDAFFIISGFLIANSFLRSRSLLVYFRKRVARIYPGFVVCMLILALAVVPIAGGIFANQSLSGRVADFIGRAAILWNINVWNSFARNPLPNVIDGSVWTIPWEFVCYIGLAAAGAAGLLHRRLFVLLTFSLMILYFLVSGAIAWIGIPPGTHWVHFFDTHIYVQLRGLPVCFVAGTAFYLYRERIPHSNIWAIVAVLVLAASCFVPYTWALCFPLAGTYLIFWFAFHPGVNIHHFARYGDFSYGTYLYAFVVQQLIVQALGHTVRPVALFLFATPPSIIMGILSWYGVERWFLGAHRRRGMDAPILRVAQVN